MPQEYFSGNSEMYVDKIKKLRNECLRLGLCGTYIFNDLNIFDFIKNYNGIGPDWEGHDLLEVMNHINIIFEPAGLLQDLHYRFNEDRSISSFNDVNHDFFENCLIILKSRYRWYDIRRYISFIDAYCLYRACCSSGEKSWRMNTRRYYI